MPALARFAAEHGIGYDLLSDDGSRTIRRLGLINAHVREQQAHFGHAYVEERHGPTPYPCVLTLDEDGVIVRRRFEQSFRVRPSGAVVLGDVGAQSAPPVLVRQALEWGEVAVWVHTASYHPNARLEAHVAVALLEPFHAYVEPVPDGFVPLAIDLAGPDGLEVEPVVLPEGRPWRVEGLPETFSVVDGEVRCAVPFLVGAEAGPVDLEVQVRCQVCTGDTCLPPTTVRLPFRLDQRPLLRP